MNGTEHRRVNIDPGNSLVPSDNEPSPETISTIIYVAIRRHYATAIKPLVPEQDGRQFEDDFVMYFLNEVVSISINWSWFVTLLVTSIQQWFVKVACHRTDAMS